MASKLKKIHLELQVRDKIIGGLLQIIADKQLTLPDYLLTAINLLYYNKINKGTKNERKRNDDNTSDASGAPETKTEAEEKKEIH